MDYELVRTGQFVDRDYELVRTGQFVDRHYELVRCIGRCCGGAY